MKPVEKTITLRFHAKMINMNKKEYDIMERKVRASAE
jgi:hypothetical protein